MAPQPGAELILDETPLDLEFGGRIPTLEIAWESWGRPSPSRDNVILLCPAFSAHSHAKSSTADPTAGWWEDMIGPGAALDTDRFHVIAASLLGGCYGTTGPNTVNAATGRPWRGDFPVVSIRDIAGVHVRLLDHLGIASAHTVVGGSMGAMEALELAIHHPSRAQRVIALSGTDRTRPATAAIRHLGRRAIMLDPAYVDGHYEPPGPVEGLRLARELGTVFYRSKGEFNDRFSWEVANAPSPDGITFEVQSYLDYQGRKIVSHFDANAYLRLSLAMDLHDVTRGFASIDEAFARTEATFLIGGCDDDRLIPLVEQEAIRVAVEGLGRPSQWFRWSSPVGHDAFLVDHEILRPVFRDFLG